MRALRARVAVGTVQTRQILDTHKTYYLVRMLPHDEPFADEKVTLAFPPTIMSAPQNPQAARTRAEPTAPTKASRHKHARTQVQVVAAPVATARRDYRRGVQARRGEDCRARHSVPFGRWRCWGVAQGSCKDRQRSFVAWQRSLVARQ
jgi:hypothetical protein